MSASFTSPSRSTADFFTMQRQARQRTTLLVFLFVLGVVGTIAALHVAIAMILVGSEIDVGAKLAPGNRPRIERLLRVLAEPKLLIAVAGTVSAVVLIGSLVRFAQLRGGGDSVAALLGGRRVSPATADPRERQLLNVVEEVAIACGVPPPTVYVLQGQDGINAFAAGYRPSEAVIGITEGALRAFTRDELQGVVAHEFAHILNGDMRLNIRLMGFLFGLLCLTVIGREIIFGMFRVGRGARRSSGDRKGGGAAVLLILAIGLALVVIGYIGVLFGRIIKAGVSRQREFLADASAVQFTRNPHGLAGALKKIGGLAAGSVVEQEHAEEASHMFFSSSLKPSFFSGGLFATHPDLADRVRALDPSFDGVFPPFVPPPAPQPEPRAGDPAKAVLRMGSVAMPMGSAMPAAALTVERVRASIGRLDPSTVQRVQSFVGAIPESLLAVARDEHRVHLLVLAMAMPEDRTLAPWNAVDPSEFEALCALQPAIRALGPMGALALFDLAVPALRQKGMMQLRELEQRVRMAVEADGRHDLAEIALVVLLRHHVTDVVGRQRRGPARYYSVSAVRGQLAVILSALAWAAAGSERGAAEAFAHGISAFPEIAGDVAPLRREALTLTAVEDALAALEDTTPPVKSRIVEGFARTVIADRVVQGGEFELVRAFCAAIEVPVPPLLIPE
jgi:Zn-dependent protease with chaperone function